MIDRKAIEIAIESMIAKTTEIDDYEAIPRTTYCHIYKEIGVIRQMINEYYGLIEYTKQLQDELDKYKRECQMMKTEKKVNKNDSFFVIVTENIGSKSVDTFGNPGTIHNIFNGEFLGIDGYFRFKYLNTDDKKRWIKYFEDMIKKHKPMLETKIELFEI